MPQRSLHSRAPAKWLSAQRTAAQELQAGRRPIVKLGTTETMGDQQAAQAARIKQLEADCAQLRTC